MKQGFSGRCSLPHSSSIQWRECEHLVAFDLALRWLQQKQNWRQQGLGSVIMLQGYTGMCGSVASPPPHSPLSCVYTCGVHAHMLVDTYVGTCVCRCACLCVHVHLEVRNWHRVSSLIGIHFIYQGRISPMIVESTD